MRRIFFFRKKRNQTIDINVADRCEDRKPKENINPLSEYHVRHRDLGKIHKAALTGNVAEVQRILLLNKNGLNEPDKCERTALHLACASDHPEVVRLLAERKCQLDLLDGDQKTALIKAIQCGNEECASILLEHGADPNVTDYRGNAALHYAAAHDNVSIAEKLLSHNAPIEAKNESYLTPLLLAVLENKQQMVEFLIRKGANIHAVDRLQRTILMLAAGHSSANIVRLLLELGLNPCSEDIDGHTATYYAFHSGLRINRLILAIGEKEYKYKMSQNNNPVVDMNVEEDHVRRRSFGLCENETKDKENMKGTVPPLETAIGEVRKPGSRPGAPVQLKDDNSVREINPEESSCKNKGKKNENRKWTSETPMVVGTSEKAKSPPGGPLQLTEDDRCCETESEEESSYEHKGKKTENRKWTSKTSKVVGTSEEAMSPPGGPLQLAEDNRCCETEFEEKSSCENKVKRTDNKKWTSRTLKVLGKSEKATSPPGGPLQLVEDNRCCETESEEKSTYENKCKKNEYKKRTSKTSMDLGTTEKAKSPPGGPLQLTEVKRFCETDSEEESSSRKSNIDDSWPTSDDDFIGLDTKEASNPNLRKLAITVRKYMENIEEKHDIERTEGRAVFQDSDSATPVEKEGATIPTIRKTENGISVVASSPNEQRTNDLTCDGDSTICTHGAGSTLGLGEEEDTESTWDSESVTDSPSSQCAGSSSGAAREKGRHGVDGRWQESPKMTPHLMPTLEERDSKAGGVEDVQTPRPDEFVNGSLRELDLQMTPEEEQERLDGSAERQPKADERRKKQSSNEVSTSEIPCGGAAAPAGEDGHGVCQPSTKADALLIPTKEHEEHDGSTKTTSKEKKEISDSCDREKDLLDRNRKLESEVATLRLKMKTIKNHILKKEKKYVEDIQILKEKNDDLQKTIKQNEATIGQTIACYSGRLVVLSTENAMLNSQLESEKKNKERLESEVESYRARLAAAIQEHDQTSKRDLELAFERAREEWFHLKEKMNLDASNLKENNERLSQQLSETKSKLNSLQIELLHAREALRERTLALEQVDRCLSQTQCQMKKIELKYTNKQCKLKKYSGKQEWKEENLCQLQREAEFCCLHPPASASQLRLQLQEEKNQPVEAIKCSEKTQDHIPKLEKEISKLKVILKDQASKTEELQKTLSKTSSSKDEKEQLKFTILKQSLEYKLDQEIKKNSELEKEKIGLKKLLHMTRRNLSVSGNREINFQNDARFSPFQMDIQLDMLKYKMDDFTTRVETASAELEHIDAKNQILLQELESM